MAMDKFMTIGQAAKYLNVCVRTLQRWDRDGKLKAVRNVINNRRMFRKEDLDSVYNINKNEKAL